MESRSIAADESDNLCSDVRWPWICQDRMDLDAAMANADSEEAE